MYGLGLSTALTVVSAQMGATLYIIPALKAESGAQPVAVGGNRIT